MGKRKRKSKRQLRDDLVAAGEKVDREMTRLFRGVTRLRKAVSAAKWAERKLREAMLPKPAANPGAAGREPLIGSGEGVDDGRQG